jgi:hypothetical protein
MYPALLLLAASGLFSFLPGTSRSASVAGTLLPVGLAVAFAVAAAGRPHALAVMAGAVAAFVGTIAWQMAPALGGGLVVVLGYAERTLRVRTVRLKAVHVGLAALAGAAAGALSTSFASGPSVERAVSVALCAVLTCVPLLVAADEPRILFLEAAAARLGPPCAATLLEGVELLRHVSPIAPSRDTAANMRKTWRSLERLVEARLRLHDGAAEKGETAALVAAMVDRQIKEHIASLARAGVAATTIGAAEAGIDDSALRVVLAHGEALDEQSRAIVEVGLR